MVVSLQLQGDISVIKITPKLEQPDYDATSVQRLLRQLGTRTRRRKLIPQVE